MIHSLKDFYVQKQRRNNHKDFQHCLFACFLSQNEPKKILEALEDESWVDAMQEELLQFKIQKVWILVDLPYGKKAIGTKWVYRNKKDERGVVVRNKARLVAQGHRQEEGIDYDEFFVPVARIEAIRIFLAFSSYMGFIVYQMDVKSAFLYGKIDEEKLGVMNLWALLKGRFQIELLKKFDFVNVKTASTPIETQKPLVKDEEASDMDVHLYRSMIGPKLGLWYPKVSSIDLEAYSDSDYAGANLNRKSTTGGCQILGRRLISWQCKKQTIVATSTIEVEYVAAASCCGQVLKIHTDDNVADLLTKAFDVSSSLGFRESLGRALDGTEALMLPKLFILWLATVSTDSAELVPMGKVSTAIETLKKNTAKALISLSPTITHSKIMAVLESCPKHNMVAYLEKTDGNAEFHEIIDFLTRSSIHHALTISLVVSTTFVEQFWTSAKHLDAKKKFVMYPRFISVFLDKQLKNVPVPLDHFPINALTSKVFSFMVKKGKHFSGKVTPLFPNMLVQPTEDEGEGSERPSEPQPIPSPPHPKGSGGNHGGQSSSDRSLSGNEGGMTLQSVYDLCISLCTQVTDQAKEIKHLKAQIKKLKKKAKPVITHHRAWMKSVSMKQRLAGKKSLKKQWMQMESVSKQGRKSAKAKPTVYKDPAFDELDDDEIDYMETEDAQDVGRTRYVVHEEKESAEKEVSTKDALNTDQPKVSTDRPDEGTDKQEVSTDKEEVSTDRPDEGTVDQTEGRSATPTTPTPTPTIFGDDETIAQVLLNMSQAKAVSREKEEKVETEGCFRRRGESSSVWKKSKLIMITVATKARFLAEQRAAAIKNRPPTRTRLRSQMMTYLKHMLAELGTKKEKIGGHMRLLDFGLEESALKDDLRKLKGKALVDNDITKHPSDLEMLKIDVEPTTPKLLNKMTSHYAYIKHTQEEATVLRDLVEHIKSKYLLDQSLESAFRYAKRIQELLTNISKTCPSINNVDGKLVVVTPKNKDKRVRFTEPVTSSGNTKTKTSSSSNLVSNKPLLSSTGVKPSTSVSGSQPSRNTKKDKIQRTPISKSKVIQIVLWYLDSGCSKHMTGDRSHLTNFVNKFLGTIKFKNDHVAKILGFGDYQIGNVTISRVYYVEGLGHIKLIISWHLVIRTLKLLIHKKKPYKPKSKDTNQEKLYLLHMDLCGPMRVASVNGKKYILVIVDDYSRFTWVKCLRSKDEAPDFIIKFLKMIQVRLKVPVRRIRTDNGTEFVNQTLCEYYEKVGISHETSVARSPQQNGVIERRNRTLIEAARTMLIYAKAPLFLWAEAVATACYTQNRSIVRLRHGKTPYELLHDKLPDLSFFHVFGALCYPTNDSENLVWELVPRPDKVMVITLKWIYKVKLDELGGILKNKARLVARGYRQEEGIDFEESFAPVARLDAI
ncbi:integrase, catalytic region, zinc finger, CCHC-type containing protein [Tanacetum coccineum]